MAVRSAQAVWKGTLKRGKGTFELGSKLCKGNYSFSSRFESGEGTNPEELVGAALAACFSMALSATLENAGYLAAKIETGAKVTIEKDQAGFSLTGIDLDVKAKVAGIAEPLFLEKVEETRKNCPISRALAATPIRAAAKLVS
jgi:osmotically inducible protein OsmC